MTSDLDHFDAVLFDLDGAITSTAAQHYIEELMLERGIEVTYETIRHWCARFGPAYAALLGATQRFLGAVSMIFPHFRPCRHRLTAPEDRQEGTARLLTWRQATGLLPAA
jgi:phosphoglycolate phosphatase-like HAD superfamily hydrolase